MKICTSKTEDKNGNNFLRGKLSLEGDEMLN